MAGTLFRKRTLSRVLHRAIGQRRKASMVTVGTIVSGLGDRSFGWLLLIFTLVNLMPLPYGATLVTALPLLGLSAQMVLGRQHVWLPERLTQRSLSTETIQRTVIRLRPLMRPLERFLRRRHEWVFTGTRERWLGAWLFLVSFALFLPLPLSGWVPALAVFVMAVGLIERDGAVTLAGAVLGACGVVLTVVVVVSLLLGVARVV